MLKTLSYQQPSTGNRKNESDQDSQTGSSGSHAVRVIGTTSSPEKAALANSIGCDEVINYTEENVVERVRELTDGKGVPVVYDGVGQATLEASLDSLSPFGLLASFGSASGPVKNFDVGVLGTK
tara:strand:+ start:158 stop:529 length:372 start_codon:yes stop_codon:yes gene_type:complete